MKTCINCNETFNDREFYKNRGGRLNTCKHCCSKRNRAYKEKHKNRLYLETQQWKKDNAAHVKAYMDRYRFDNKDHILEVQKAWIENNKEHHRAIKNACNAQRRFSKKCATVEWANKKAIKSFYNTAQRLSLLTGIEHHVDHIIPLVNDLVCGLHCEDNLQVLPWYENIAKGNKLGEDIV